MDRTFLKKNDWTCPCGGINFASRDACRTCGMAKNQSSNVPVKKPGDWNCACGEINFANRQICRKCSQSRPQTLSSVQMGGRKPGDWNCTCGELNFARNTACRKCGAGKSAQQPQDPSNSVVPIRSNEPLPKPGDWNCVVCGRLNFAHRRCCISCKTVPALASKNNLTASSSVPMKPGDWNCACGELNFARNQACRKCRVAKSQPPPTQQPNPTVAAPMELDTADDTDDDDKNLCVVCMCLKAEVAITVCGHLALCLECAPKLHSCPMCRAPYSANQILKIFHSGF